jgi:TonB family protein
MRFLLTLALFSLTNSFPVQATVEAVLSGRPGQPQDPAPAPETQSPAKPARIRLGGNVAAVKIINKVQPVYPPLARQTRISGTVRLHAILAKDGTIQQLETVSGHPLLVQAALDAVRQWRYQPTLLNGDPVEVDTTIDIVFALAEDNPAPKPAADSASDPAIDPQFRDDILRLFEVIHFKENAAKAGRQVFESLRPALMASLPATRSRERITDAYIDKLLALMQSDSHTERVVAIYAKYFSDQDVQELVRFYQTPTGQHFNAAMPQLFGDLSQIGQQLALDNIPAIFKQLCKEFPELQDDARFCKDTDPQKKSQLAVPDRPLAPADPASAPKK